MQVTTALILLSMLLGLCGLPTVAGAAVEGDLQARMAAAPEGTQRIILHFSPADHENSVLPQRTVRRSERATLIQALRQRSARDQQRARQLLTVAGVSSRELWMVNALALEASPQLIARLAALPEVAEVRLDRLVRLPVRPAAEAVSGVSPAAAHWNLEAIGAPALWSRGLTGAGVVVASVDSGVDLAHADLAAAWRGGSNSWFDPNGQHATPFDAEGHGTGTLGVILGRNSGSGVAPGASWIAVKIFDDVGMAFNSRIHQGFQWLLDPDGNPATDDAPDIVNNSWGFEEDSGLCDQLAREFQPDVQALKAAGIAVVFAAGNTGPAAGSSVSPGNYAESLAVGAVDPLLQLPAFSARGPSACDGRIYPDLVAPGVAIQTPDLTSGGLFPNALQTVSGTSFAAPHLAGVMALLLSDPARPAPPLAELETALKRSATDLGPSGADNGFGHGLVNALAAYNRLNQVPQLAFVDPTPPANDRLVTFGHVAPGSLAERAVELVNAGGGQLDIIGIDISTLPANLSLLSNSCSSLPAGERCALVLRFAPLELGSVAATLAISSSDPAQGLQILQLEGVGNTLPSPATLVTPAAGATEATTTVLFGWNPGADGDGDLLAETLVLARSADFSGAASFPFTAAAGATAGVALAGACGLLGFGLLRRRPLVALGLLLATLLTLCACGGGGGGGGLPAAAATLRLTGLQPGTTYFWKVQTSDSRGGVSESAVRQFTTGV
jgi:bacillopeptidase F